VVASPDESHLYVANNGSASISAFTIAPSTGVLTEVAGSPFAIVGDIQPFASALDSSGAHLYVGCNDGVRVFTVNASTGALVAAPALDAPIPGRVEGDVLMHPSGRWLYVADHGHEAIQVYAVDAASGALTFVAAAPSAGGPTGLTFDRAASRIFSRGTDVTPTFNAQIHVFAVDAFSGALNETSTYHGYGPNPILNQMNADAQMPFVAGVDSHLHGLAYSKRPGVDALYNAYSQDLSIGGGEGFAFSSFDVSPDGITGDRTEGFLGSPFVIDILSYSSLGGSVFVDRSGSAVVLTEWISSTIGVNNAVYYPTDPSTGTVMGVSGISAFNIEYSLASGAGGFLVNQTHGAFIGQLQ
jgi:DNA-binding beta-propeller fold protein YncE